MIRFSFLNRLKSIPRILVPLWPALLPLIFGIPAAFAQSDPYDDVAVEFFWLSLEGNRPSEGKTAPGGQGGYIEVQTGVQEKERTGVEVDTGTGEDKDLYQSQVLGAPGREMVFNYRQVALNKWSTEDTLVTTITGKVTIHCQYLFDANVILKPGAELTVMAGQAIYLNPPITTSPEDTFPAFHLVNVTRADIDDPAPCSFKFLTSQRGNILGGVFNANGGDGSQGGDGGEVRLNANDFEVYLWGAGAADGGTSYGDSNGAQGGHGGSIIIQGKDLFTYTYPTTTGTYVLSARGGDGDAGANGEDGSAGAAGVAGKNGGDGGHGGLIMLRQTAPVNPTPAINVDGGRGGNGGHGGFGGSVAASTRAAGGGGGAGGKGGRGGAAGRIDAYTPQAGSDPANPQFVVQSTLGTPGVGGDGGNGGQGGNGYSGGPGGRAGDGGNAVAPGSQVGQPGLPGDGGSASGGTAGAAGASGTKGQVVNIVNPILSQDHPLPTLAQKKKWTFMFYMGGDDPKIPTEYELAAEIDHLEEVPVFKAQKNTMNLVVQFDRDACNGTYDLTIGKSEPKIPYHQYWSETLGYWQDTRRGFICHDDDPSRISTVLVPVIDAQESSEHSTGDPAALQDFIKWSMKNAPAENYVLVICGHTQGGIFGMLKDYAIATNVCSVPDPLKIKELKQALIQSGIGPHLPLLVLDCCGAQSIETLADLFEGSRPLAKYLVATEYLSQWDGIWLNPWRYSGSYNRYHLTLSEMVQDANREWQDLDIANQIFEHTINHGLTVVDMAKVPAMIASLNTFFNAAIANNTSASKTFFQDQWWQIYLAHGPRDLIYSNFIDLVYAISNVAAFHPLAAIRSSAANVLLSMDNGVFVKHKADRPTLQGLLIYARPDGKLPSYYGSSDFSFLAQTSYLQFMEQVLDTTYEHKTVVPPNQGSTIAAPVVLTMQAGQQYNVLSSLPTNNAVAFFSLTAQAGALLYANLSGNALDHGLNPLLTVYAPDKHTVLGQFRPDATGVVSGTTLTLARAGTYYVAVSAVGNVNPLAPTGGQSHGDFHLNLIMGTPAQLAPRGVLSATAVTFSAAPTDEIQTKYLTLTNTGLTPLSILQVIQPANQPFEADLRDLVIAPGDQASIAIKFYPLTISSYNGTLTLKTNSPSTPQLTIALRATSRIGKNSILLNLLGIQAMPAALKAAADVNHDGIISIADVIKLN